VAFAEARSVSHQGGTFTIYTVDLETQDLKLYWKSPEGTRHQNIARLKDWLRTKNKTVTFGTNAGIFDTFHTPKGLYIENGRELVGLNTGPGWGNFFLKPNGVFILREKTAEIVKTDSFSSSPEIKFAVQSGPMLVLNNTIHPAFKKGSKNQLLRSGVGTSSPTRVVFAISNGKVRFYDFATLFRDVLGCSNAIYLDGLISKMYAPDAGRRQTGGNFAALFAVTENSR
jgi:uncharacterized protein YigE (DUF2233 family)